MPLTAADVLAGPIVRRVDAERACVWVALAKPATQVLLQVFAGRGRRADLGAPMAAAATADVGFENRTIAIGAQLHIALAVFEPQLPARLDWGMPYSYDLRVTCGGDETGLGELGLLEDNVALPGYLGVPHPHLALGYAAGALPSFVLPPLDPKDLRVAHGSCRRHCVAQRDATALLDDLLQRAELDPAQRIHQLLFTGDQVYADAVSGEQLRMMSALSLRLLGGGAETVERIPVDLVLDPAQPSVRTPADVPVDMFHLPAARRTHLINDLGGGTSTDAESHTLGFGEAAALYLTAWAGTTWPALQPLLDERWLRVDDFRHAYRTLMTQAQGRLKPEEVASSEWSEHAGELRERLQVFEAWRLLPPELREIDRHLSEAERLAEWLPKDDPKPVPRAVTYGWEAFWVNQMRGPANPDFKLPGLDSAASAAPPPPNPLRAALARALTPSWYAGHHFWRARVNLDADGKDLVIADSGRDQLSMMQWYLDDLPKVRRVLANTPTLMMFDDHEVTDDWNISAEWVRRTNGSALGRSMLRNMLSAYALFQHWGNDPVAFRSGPQLRLLAQLQLMFFDSLDGSVPRAAGPPAEVRNTLDRLFDLRVPDAEPTPGDERVHWHFSYRGARHELIALDSRTWRGFDVEGDPEIGQPVSLLASTALITDESLVMQIPEKPDPGTELTLVIASAPFIGMPVAENIVQPTLNAVDSLRLPAEGPFVARQQSTRVGRMNKDPEPFGFVPRLFEAMLARLANRKRVVLLSGDVHYALTLAMSYWRFAGEPLTARFVQLISSSLRNPRGQGDMELFTMDLVQQLGALTAEQSRIGWKKPLPGEPRVLTGGDRDVNFRIRRLLQEDPVMLPAEALPPGTATAPPQWAWRMALLPDVRADAQRLTGIDLPLVQSDIATDPAQAFVELAHRHRFASENIPPRRWMWWTNVGVVDFARDDTGAMSVRHRLFSWDIDGANRGARDRLAATAALEVGAGELPPQVRLA